MHVYQLYKCFIHAEKLFLGRSLPVAPTVRVTFAERYDMANMLQRQIVQFPPRRDTADLVSSGRVQEVKSNRKFETVISNSGCLQEVPNTVV